MKIALSKCFGSDNYTLYSKWIKYFDKNINTIDCNSVNPELIPSILSECSGLILTGGSDVNPALYGMPEELSRCYTNLDRDDLDFLLISNALSLKLPILAICRGMQILNVFLGGNLIVDIASDTDSKLEHRAIEGQDSEHLLFMDKNSVFTKIIGESEGIVNSLHHQAVNFIGNGLKATAVSSDRIIEAVESDNRLFSQFILGIQYHPERMDFSNIFSKNLAKKYIEICTTYSLAH